MNEPTEAIPFQRTVCACVACTACCRRQPGFLIPGDAEHIEAFIGKPVADFIWASPGAIVATGGNTFRIGTITPRWDKKRKCCVFLTDAGQCSIHSVAPYGCAYADTHMSRAQGEGVSAWGLRQIILSTAYKKLRDTLPLATHHQPNRYHL